MNLQEPRFDDDDRTPNHPDLPVRIYAGAFSSDVEPEEIEARFTRNGWPAAWRWGVYDFDHYHSTAHEVLGCFAGRATLRLGGEEGEEFEVGAGDVVMLPAGTGHCCVAHSPDFQVVGAYPEGQEADLIRAGDGEIEAARRRIREVPFPESDPVTGRDGE